MTESTANQVRTARSPSLVLAFLCVAGFMTFVDVSIVNVSLPTIERELGITETYLQYVVTAYGTVLGGFLLLGGRLADTFGRRRMLRGGLVGFARSPRCWRAWRRARPCLSSPAGCRGSGPRSSRPPR
ncbi:MFS transporter [Fodinicola feengrottensis]|uniref:MFS transporter n=1 Tax=Fodinicola feengrottensis TaxID=435914 RepID=UPI00244154C3|nr:MFS transporter [Fodinicola feengrottensis]